MVVKRWKLDDIKQLFQIQKTPFKRASTLCQKWFEKKNLKKGFFCQKGQNFVYFRAYDFIQISLVCGTNIS